MTDSSSSNLHQETGNHASGQLSKPSTSSSSATQQSGKIRLQAALRQFLDFPIPGIDFIDILPLFATPSLHTLLIDCLATHIYEALNGQKPDVIVALDARGFLFGPSLALKLGAGFAPVRKRGKLPGPTVEAAFVKEYGEDYFQLQEDAIKPGQTVFVVDDIIATGKFIEKLMYHAPRLAC
jgi:adenine phosphoribosyltransferase